MFLKKVINKIQVIYSRRNSKSFVNFLRKKGCNIGEYTHFHDPKTVYIDPNRCSFIEIGDKCQITRNVTILAHDFSYSVCRSVYNNLPQNSGITVIGNNCFIGMNSIILMGSKIGDNVILGAGSVVSGNIPSNSVVAGNPAKVICTLDEYYKKRCKKFEESAFIYASNIMKKKNRIPTIEEMGIFATLFKKEDEKKYYEKIVYPSDNSEDIVNCLINMKSKYKDYQEFIEAVKMYIEKNNGGNNTVM